MTTETSTRIPARASVAGRARRLAALMPGWAFAARNARTLAALMPARAFAAGRARTLAALALLGAVAACTGEAWTVAWSLGDEDGVRAPESAYYDADTGALFISQMGEGGGGAKDGDGWISKLDTAGKILNDKWVVGLNAPKGLRSHRGTLWVTDIDRLIAIHIASGRIAHTVEVPDAKFLNDVAIDDEGAVYVSDMQTSRIHRYHNGELSVFAEGRDMENPNGLLVEKDKLIVAAWGLDIQHDFSTAVPGRLYALDLKTRQRTDLTEPLGNLDGLEADGRGGHIVTDWVSGDVYRIRKGEVKIIMKLPKGAADIAFLTDRDRLIIPRMLENQVTAFDLKAAAF